MLWFVGVVAVGNFGCLVVNLIFGLWNYAAVSTAAILLCLICLKIWLEG